MKIYYIIVTSIFFVFLSISCKIIENDYSVVFDFKNKLNQTIIFQVYQDSTKITPIFEKPLKYGESFFINELGLPDAAPFWYTKNKDRFNNYKSKFIKIKISNNKCIKYYRNSDTFTQIGLGVFGLINYDNYSKALIEKKEYTLFYSISEKDLAFAKDCE